MEESSKKDKEYANDSEKTLIEILIIFHIQDKVIHVTLINILSFDF